MTRASCPDCRLRFSPAASVALKACPECGAVLRDAAEAQEVLGFALHPYGGELHQLLQTMAAALDPESAASERPPG